MRPGTTSIGGFGSPQAGRVTESTSRSLTWIADAAERIDEVGEAAQVDERVVVDANAEQPRDRLLERRRAGSRAAREELGLLRAKP